MLIKALFWCCLWTERCTTEFCQSRKPRWIWPRQTFQSQPGQGALSGFVTLFHEHTYMALKMVLENIKLFGKDNFSFSPQDYSDWLILRSFRQLSILWFPSLDLTASAVGCSSWKYGVRLGLRPTWLTAEVMHNEWFCTSISIYNIDRLNISEPMFVFIHGVCGCTRI